MQYWQNDAIFEVHCPECDASVEFYKDDTTRKCHSCGHRFVNPKMDFGCASYCQFAEQCLGTLPEDFLGSREDLIKDKVAVEVKRYYQTDFKSIKKATNIARLVENLGKTEGGNLGVLLCAAFLHGLAKADITAILTKVAATPPLITAIEDILTSEDKKNPETELADTILRDALALYEYQETVRGSNNEKSSQNPIIPALSTDSAKILLKEMLP